MRVALGILAMSVGAQVFAQSPAQTPTHEPSLVVFVCEHGSVKSLIATSYFNQRAQQRGLPFRAVARGTAPEPAVPAQVRDGLRASGFDVSGYVPQLLRPSDVDGASLVISFDQQIEAAVGGRAQYVKWDNLPAVLAHYAQGRDEIVKRVDALIGQLARAADTDQDDD
jgi:hypothetical protein